MRCNAIIYHCMSWVICFSRLFIRDLFTNNDPVSVRPPSQSNAVLLFLLTAGASFSLSLFLYLSFFLCLTWTTRPFFPRHTAWIVWEDAGEKKRAWGCRDKETSGCVNALRLNVSVAVWPHTCDPVHNERVCVRVCLHGSVCLWSYSMSYSGCIQLLLTKVIETMSFSKANL